MILQVSGFNACKMPEDVLKTQPEFPPSVPARTCAAMSKELYMMWASRHVLTLILTLNSDDSRSQLQELTNASHEDRVHAEKGAHTLLQACETRHKNTLSLGVSVTPVTASVVKISG